MSGKILLATIQIARGTLANRPATGLPGEPYYATDNGALYVFFGGVWMAVASGGGVDALANLIDVQLTSPSNGQVLKYESETGKWVNATEAGGSLAGDSDVQLTNPVAGQVLKYSSILQKWYNATDTSSGTLAGLSDIDLTSPTDGQVLAFDSVSGLWVNQTESGGGGVPAGSNIYLLPRAKYGDYTNGAPGNTVGWGGYSLLTAFDRRNLVNSGSRFKIGVTAFPFGPTFNPGVWQAFTDYTNGTAIIDSNGNVQVSQSAFGPGLSGATHPTWATGLGATTEDGNPSTGFTWKNYGPATGLVISKAVFQTYAPIDAVDDDDILFVSSVPITWNGGNGSPSLGYGENLSDAIECDISPATSYQVVIYFATSGTSPLSFLGLSGAIPQGTATPNWPYQIVEAGDWTAMTTPWAYEFGYSQPLAGGLLIGSSQTTVGINRLVTA